MYKLAIRLVASTLKNQAKDVATGNRATERTPDGVDDIASAITSSVELDVHERAQTAVTVVANNVDIGRNLDNGRVDTRGIVALAAVLDLVELLDDVVVSLPDAVTVAVGVLGFNDQVVGLVGTQLLGRAAVSRELDGVGAFARDVLAQLVKCLVELVKQQLARVVLRAVALLVVTLAALARLVVERTGPFLDTVL